MNTRSGPVVGCDSGEEDDEHGGDGLERDHQDHSRQLAGLALHQPSPFAAADRANAIVRIDATDTQTTSPTTATPHHWSINDSFLFLSRRGER